MRHSILQYNTDCFNHGSDYFGEVTKDVDYALFQRLPIKSELSGPNIKEIHLERSIPNARKSLYVGIARFHGKSKFESCISFNLPSKDIVRATGDNFQGSKALCTGIDKIVRSHVDRSCQASHHFSGSGNLGNCFTFHLQGN